MGGAGGESGELNHLGDAIVDVEVFEDGVLADEGADAVTTKDESVFFENAERLADDSAGCAEHLPEFGFGGELAAGTVGAAKDGLAELLLDGVGEGFAGGAGGANHLVVVLSDVITTNSNYYDSIGCQGWLNVTR